MGTKTDTLFPFMSSGEREKLSNTLEDLSRNSMIRTEVICKRSEGMTVEEACQDLEEKVHLSWLRIRDIYYGKRTG